MLCGCSTSPSDQKISTSQKSICPDQPQGSLEDKHVKKISLVGNKLTESGQVNTGQHKGFSFDAKKNQKIIYQTKDDVCIWIYTPSSDLLKSDETPVDGIYTVQIAALKGSTSFTLDLQLKDSSSSQSNSTSLQSISPTEKTVSNGRGNLENSSNSSPSNQVDPEEFIRIYYSNINKRNYDSTWASLSSNFQSMSGGFSGYKDWWDSVDKIQVISTTLMNNDNGQATVNAKIRYFMKTGVDVDDEKGLFYLSWNSDKKNWELIKKTSP